MSLDHAILGFLHYMPLSGYDLKKRFDSSVQHFWSADQSQIYRTLTRLSEQGWVACKRIGQEARPARKVYHLTEAGSQELRRWLSGPIPVQDSRSAPLVQIFFAAQLSDAELLEKFEFAAGLFRSIIESFERIPPVIDDYSIEFGSRRDAFCWGLTLEIGLKTMQANLEWAESVVARIRSGQIPAQD